MRAKPMQRKLTAQVSSTRAALSTVHRAIQTISAITAMSWVPSIAYH
jgi:hypothetical protein